MDLLQLICERVTQNSVNNLSSKVLKYAGLIYEHTLGEEKYIFFEEVKNLKSVTILVKRPNSHTIVQINNAICDGLRTVKNAIEDKCIVPEVGVFQAELLVHLNKFKSSVKGKPKWKFKHLQMQC
ncbi:7504_t:CDS:2 [Funneliformis caledonium]|uniref:7504_t:CDS:1 n=1 Tax=Funneliformis caledonium TaxID=1117310 RepID=A0A9N9B218_9GLOM|nr:7504_t:CDS:2 [Funneliformis caledonium]